MRKATYLGLPTSTTRSIMAPVITSRMALSRNLFEESRRDHGAQQRVARRLQAANRDLPVMTVISYDGSDDWVEPHIREAKKCLMRESTADRDKVGPGGRIRVYQALTEGVNVCTLPI